MHVCHIQNRPQSGVDVVVPKYIKHQSNFMDMGLLNLHHSRPAELDDKKYSVFNYKSLIHLDQILKTFQPDIVIFHGVYYGLFARIAKRLTNIHNIPYVIIPHGSLSESAQRQKHLKKATGNLLLFGRFIKNAASVQYLSALEKQQSHPFHYGHSFVRGNGIELKGRMKKDFSTDQLKLVYIGRLDVEIKGIDRLISAIGMAQDDMRKNNITLSIRGVGSKKNIAKIKSLIRRYAISDIISLEGGVFGEEKISTLIKYDCFIQLSRTEGQPLGLMEAMDIGMPCIVTKGTTFYDIAEKHNAGIPVGDSPGEIARVILDIRNGKYELSKISLNASKYAKSQFNWDALGKTMVESYKKIIRNRSSRGANQ